MTIFDILKADHKKVDVILKQMARTSGAQAVKRKTLFAKLQENFTLHAKSEEKAVYAPLNLKSKTHGEVMEAYEEHGLVEHLFYQLAELSVEDDAWTAKMAVLTELVRAHVKDEEAKLFKKMKAVCSGAELAQMARNFRGVQREKANYSLNKKTKANQATDPDVSQRMPAAIIEKSQKNGRESIRTKNI